MKNNNAFLFFSIGMLFSCAIFWILIETSFESDLELPKINLNNVFQTNDESKKTDNEATKSKQSTNVIEKATGTKVLKCTKSEKDDDNYKSDKTLTITYKNNELKTYEEKIKTETNPDNIEFMIDVSKGFGELFSKISGVETKVTKISNNSFESYTKITYDKLDMEQLSKVFADDSNNEIAGNDMFKKTGVEMDEYKKQLEQEGYSCK